MQIGVPRATLSIDAIQTMLSAAVARAKALDAKLHITIMDHAGNLAGFISFPGAPRIAEVTANRKAFTAVNTGMPTHQWEAYVNSIPPSELKIIELDPGLCRGQGRISDHPGWLGAGRHWRFGRKPGNRWRCRRGCAKGDRALARQRGPRMADRAQRPSTTGRH